MNVASRKGPQPLPHVLVVDDDLDLCELLALRLQARGYRVTTETTAAAGLARLGGERVDAMVLDLRLADADGLDVLAQALARSPDVPVVILTAHGTIETAVEAMQRGAYGFLTKPFEDHELLQKLAHAVERGVLRREVEDLRRIVGGASEEQRLVGVSEAIARVREVVARIGPTEASVLITGESGTGKELAARQIHASSPRRGGPFVAVNCGALPPDLLESELFGHVKGAFTGAVRDREGLFGAARGGTLFLDEIGEASPAVQVKLLRTVQERRFTRVGATAEEEADVRLVAATNRDLREELAAGRFREDLYYRLHVVPLNMPPLRERREDILLLAEIFLERAAGRYGMTVPRLSGEAVRLLLTYSWPGNVRELMHEMEAALLLADSAELRAEHLQRIARPPAEVRRLRDSTSVPTVTEETPSAGSGSPIAPEPASVPREAARGLPDFAFPKGDLPSMREAREAFDRAYLVEVLRRSGGNVSAAARMAGRNRSDFYDLLRRNDISPTEFKEALAASLRGG